MDEFVFRGIYTDLYHHGKLSSPRGLLVKEIENFNYELPPYVRFINFEARKLKLSYIKQEFAWYLQGDKFDVSIGKYASMWNQLINDDGSINSNYGQYIFSELNQFDNIIEILSSDKDSRRASIVILSDHHLKMVTPDVPCTYSINFRIRENYLNMTVRMRSQDAILGMGNDVPAFSFIHEMVYVTLKEKYPELKYGMYYHSADSFHVYERHFPMLEKIINGDRYIPIECPKMLNIHEVNFLRRFFMNTSQEIPEEYKFTRWLLLQ